MREATDLSTIVVDHDRAAAEGLFDESRDHHPVVAHLTRADDIEEPADRHAQSVLSVVGQREEFVDGLGASIGPAGLGGRAEVQVVLFCPGGFGVLPVRFAG